MNMRTEWCGDKYDDRLDLSRNVIYDKQLHQLIVDRLSDVDPHKLARYPDERHLHETICNMHDCGVDQLAVGLGASEILQRIIKHMSGKVLHVISPTFKMVEIYCDMYNVEIKKLQYHDHNMFDMNKIIDVDTLYLANPNGINGHSFTHEQIEYISSKCKMLILDEAYADYSDYQHTYTGEDNLMIVKTFSKSLGFAGARCGYMITHRNNIQQLSRYRPAIVTTTLATEIIPGLIQYLPDVVDRMIHTRNMLQHNYEHVSSAGNYVLIHEKHQRDFINIKHKRFGQWMRMALCDMETLNGHK